MDDPAGAVRRTLERNRYLVLGTTEPDGAARLSPVFFTHTDARTFYWVSSPEAQHSRNIAERPNVSLVVFDGDTPPSEDKDAVYVSATAEQVPDAELAGECGPAFADSERRGARAFRSDELSGDGDLRLYRAVARTHEVHLRGSDPMTRRAWTPVSRWRCRD
jgi:Pyridoxamine 5'-phosphate oxidase